MKKLTLATVAVAAVLALAGCSSGAPDAAPTETKAAAEATEASTPTAEPTVDAAPVVDPPACWTYPLPDVPINAVTDQSGSEVPTCTVITHNSQPVAEGDAWIDALVAQGWTAGEQFVNGTDIKRIAVDPNATIDATTGGVTASGDFQMATYTIIKGTGDQMSWALFDVSKTSLGNG
ncbi:hypothetical protein [uncultured Microbacterium sp.]|uniref:hypothetical protein n=1 Tax=uncultured Microbacterium sp. TaxID=191216 RepID=UPI002622FC19|nr:hypothetical protein [uncultured Microbacterium sp.]